MIPFNKPYITGTEIDYLRQVLQEGKLSGNGLFTKKCQTYFETRFEISKSLLTTSCTDSLEMTAILSGICPGDEVIMPSYTFVSTALAFVRQGAVIRFIDSCDDHPNMDIEQIEPLINSKTKAIVPVHYAGVACDMDRINQIGKKYGILIIEDAAQAIDSYYNGKALGSLGDFGCFSFHDTKNIQCGEGGLLAINNEVYNDRAEIIWEKGTNRSAFFRGQIDKYGWVDTGSSFLPSELTAAFLLAQLESLELIQKKRKILWQTYDSNLSDLVKREWFTIPSIPDYATNNAHSFFIVCNSPKERTELIHYLREHNIAAAFHYQSLHQSVYYKDKHDSRILPNSDKFTNCLLRLPLYNDLGEVEINTICSIVYDFFKLIQKY